MSSCVHSGPLKGVESSVQLCPLRASLSGACWPPPRAPHELSWSHSNPRTYCPCMCCPVRGHGLVLSATRAPSLGRPSFPYWTSRNRPSAGNRSAKLRGGAQQQDSSRTAGSLRPAHRLQDTHGSLPSRVGRVESGTTAGARTGRQERPRGAWPRCWRPRSRQV